MLRVVLSFFVLSVLSEALPPPPPPQNIHVDKWLLTWTPADTEEGKVTFTVEYSSFDSDEWHYVPACVHISSNSCDVTAISTKARHHCVRLRVQAERRGLNSSSVEACSQHSDTCTPAVRLTELPGSLIVPLNRKHDLAVEYGDHAGHRVYFRKEGTLQENFTDNVSTVSIPDLEEGQRYCVRTQYTYFDKPVGLPSCPRCVLVPRPVLSEALPPPPPPPQNIHVDKWLLTWTPADTEEGKVTFTVEYSSFDSDEWHYVPACVHISSNSCDVTAISTKARHHCVRLRVQAERRGLNSSSVEACSQHSDTCTPAVRLTELPGSLIVPLNRKHDLAVEYGDHAGHRVYFRKEGTLQENFTDNVSTVSIPDLEEGQRYCVRIQYTYFDEPVGLPSCPRCVLVPRPEKDSTQTALIVSLVVVVVLVILVPLIAYVLINYKEAFKECMRNPYEIPPHFLPDEQISVHHPPVNTSCCTEERCDVISVRRN